ncbi:MAG: aminotransferase class I/II-fold pyridoxal phosphate-dependent enzyme [Xanthobacteraceae bacterium]
MVAPALFDPLACLKACDPMPYRYSQGLPAIEAVLTKLGFPSDRVGALITENGTTSISTVANCLKLNGVAEVTLLTPSYFTTAHSLRRLGIAVRETPLEHGVDGCYTLPAGLAARPHEALWLTNPVYSTGLYALEQSCDVLRQIADAGTLVVADESLAGRPTAIARALGGHENFVGIYTPHKSICMNGMKFSAVVAHPRQQATLEDWAEVLSGGLSLSATIAMQHFLTTSFDDCRAAFARLLRAARDWHVDLVRGFDGTMVVDSASEGHFVMTYLPRLAASLRHQTDFLEEILTATGCILIPGFRSGFDERSGFCFRVNLARDSHEFRGAVARLYAFLSAKHETGLRALRCESAQREIVSPRLERSDARRCLPAGQG